MRQHGWTNPCMPGPGKGKYTCIRIPFVGLVLGGLLGVPTATPDVATPEPLKSLGVSSQADFAFKASGLLQEDEVRLLWSTDGKEMKPDRCTPIKGSKTTSRTACAHAAGCSKRATYGLRDRGGGRLFCAQHRTKTMIDLNIKRCKHPEGCSGRAYFAAALLSGNSTRPPKLRIAHTVNQPQPSLPIALYCSKHTLRGAKRGRGQQCTGAGCQVMASFGPLNTRTPRRCSRHRLPSDVDTRHATCVVRKCSKRAYYGAPGGSPLSCLQHKLHWHIDVISKRCEFKTQITTIDNTTAAARVSRASSSPKRQGMCASQANFGDALEGRKRFCAKHCRPSDVDLRKRRNRGLSRSEGAPARSSVILRALGEERGRRDGESLRPHALVA
jgi:hypothetical protein